MCSWFSSSAGRPTIRGAPRSKTTQLRLSTHPEASAARHLVPPTLPVTPAAPSSRLPARKLDERPRRARMGESERDYDHVEQSVSVRCHLPRCATNVRCVRFSSPRSCIAAVVDYRSSLPLGRGASACTAHGSCCRPLPAIARIWRKSGPQIPTATLGGRNASAVSWRAQGGQTELCARPAVRVTRFSTKIDHSAAGSCDRVACWLDDASVHCTLRMTACTHTVLSSCARSHANPSSTPMPKYCGM